MLTSSLKKTPKNQKNFLDGEPVLNILSDVEPPSKTTHF